jgi:hypothetical protein
MELPHVLRPRHTAHFLAAAAAVPAQPGLVIIGLIQPVLYLAFFGPLFSRVFSSGLISGARNSYAYFVPGC